MSTLPGGTGSLWGAAGTGVAPTPTGQAIKPLLYMAARLAHLKQFADATQSSLSPDQFADLVLLGQLMISQAQLKRAMIFSISIDDYVIGTAEKYTLGPGGTLVSTTGTSIRPVMIERAKLILRTGTPVYLEVFQGDYNALADLAIQQIAGALPKFLYCDYDTPLATIYLVPQDQGGDTLELYTWQAVPTIATIDDLVRWPPGYDDWFVNNLAVRAASVFAERGAFVTDDTRLEARKTAAAIQSRNTSSPRLKSDAPGSRRGRGGFNYYSGMDA